MKPPTAAARFQLKGAGAGLRVWDGGWEGGGWEGWAEGGGGKDWEGPVGMTCVGSAEAGVEDERGEVGEGAAAWWPEADMRPWPWVTMVARREAMALIMPASEAQRDESSSRRW